jgi:hypothetical protein
VSPSDIESSTAKIAVEFAEMGIDLKTALKGKVGRGWVGWLVEGLAGWRGCLCSGWQMGDNQQQQQLGGVSP